METAGIEPAQGSPRYQCDGCGRKRTDVVRDPDGVARCLRCAIGRDPDAPTMDEVYARSRGAAR